MYRILYVIGICVEMIGQEKNDYAAGTTNQESISAQSGLDDFNNYMYFGTVLRSMTSLFNMVVLDEWGLSVRL